ncbi:MAG TPA: ABC-type transport auxiliary lipoprotein family protein [Polyangiaceae bacterium]
MTSRWIAYGWALFAIAALSSCALTSKADLVEPRYFSPERVELREQARPGTSVLPIAVRLGRVASSADLREHIAHRDTEFELGYYDDLRWNERPEAYVRRAISRALFERHGLPHAQMGNAATLELELVAFEELRLPKLHAARIRLRALLYQNDRVLLEQTVTTDRALPKDARIDDVVAAMATALEAAAETIATKVETQLRGQAATSQPLSEAENVSKP